MCLWRMLRDLLSEQGAVRAKRRQTVSAEHVGVAAWKTSGARTGERQIQIVQRLL